MFINNRKEVISDKVFQSSFPQGLKPDDFWDIFRHG
jgi:hypothetical protein